MRHSPASILLKQGVHSKVMQERPGHSSISVTLDTYSHVVPGLQDAVAAAGLMIWCYRGMTQSKNSILKLSGKSVCIIVT